MHAPVTGSGVQASPLLPGNTGVEQLVSMPLRFGFVDEQVESARLPVARRRPGSWWSPEGAPVQWL
jgi:hypothetical protein